MIIIKMRSFRSSLGVGGEGEGGGLPTYQPTNCYNTTSVTVDRRRNATDQCLKAGDPDVGRFS